MASGGYFNFPEVLEYKIYEPMLTPNGTVNLCDGDSIEISVNEGLAFNWSNGETTPTLKAFQAGLYFCDVTYANGCMVRTDTLEVSLNPIITPNAGADKTINCGQTTNLTGTATGGVGTLKYLWIGGPSNAAWNNVSAGTYILSVTDDNNCAAYDTVEVTNTNSNFGVVSPVDTVVCENSEVTLTPTITGTPTALQYKWSNGFVTPSIDVNILKSDVSLSVEITDMNTNCSESATFNLSVISDTTILDIIGDLNICKGEEVTLSHGSQANYTWSTGETTPSITVNQAGSFFATKNLKI